MKGNRADDIVRTDPVLLAFVQLQADHALFMRRRITAATPGAASPCRQFMPPRRFPFSSLRIFLPAATLNTSLHIGDLCNRALLLISPGDLQCGGGNVERVMPCIDKLLNHFKFAFETPASKPDFDLLNHLCFTVTMDRSGCGQFHLGDELLGESFYFAQATLLTRRDQC